MIGRRCPALPSVTTSTLAGCLFIQSVDFLSYLQLEHGVPTICYSRPVPVRRIVVQHGFILIGASYKAVAASVRWRSYCMSVPLPNRCIPFPKKIFQWAAGAPHCGNIIGSAAVLLFDGCSLCAVFSE